MKNELAKDPLQLFEFDPVVPIASASIGQVYKARLKSSNALVAIKVQRPNALSSAAIDMFILRKLAAVVKKWKKLRSDLVGVVDQFGNQLFSELNYVSEARNCMKFRELYGNIKDIYVPYAFTNMTTPRVLVMEFVEGVKGPWKVGGQKMLTVGLQCSVMQVLGTGYFHSDPHRGNLLQTPDGKLAYLDFGKFIYVYN
jgi:predicted unusual protein kinase regulating ubiquinone biosynthesis (AarF/ABC1/UbiB family)